MRSGGALTRVVADTNLIVSGLLSEQGRPYELVEALRAGEFIPVLSTPLYDEYARVLRREHLVRRFRLTADEVAAFLAVISGRASWVSQRLDPPMKVRDAKDEMVLATALAGRADYLVTGDEDLLILRDDAALGGLQIVTAREFLDLIRPSPP